MYFQVHECSFDYDTLISIHLYITLILQMRKLRLMMVKHLRLRGEAIQNWQGWKLTPRPFLPFGDRVGQDLRKPPKSSGKRCSRPHLLAQEHDRFEPICSFNQRRIPGPRTSWGQSRGWALSNPEYFIHHPESDQAAFLP